MPLRDKSLRDWVAKMTATFDLRSTFNRVYAIALTSRSLSGIAE